MTKSSHDAFGAALLPGQWQMEASRMSPKNAVGNKQGSQDEILTLNQEPGPFVCLRSHYVIALILLILYQDYADYVCCKRLREYGRTIGRQRRW